MATKVTRDHHNFRRTLSLNDNKISNDGGDEGISVEDNGTVSLTRYLNLVDAGRIIGAGVLKVETEKQLELDSTNVSGTLHDGTLFQNNGTTIGVITGHHALTDFTLYEAHGASTDDFFVIEVAEHGVTVLATVDAASNAAHLKLIPDGDIRLAAGTGTTTISFQSRFCFDDGGDTYMTSGSADVLDIVVGDDIMARLTENGGGASNTFSIGDAVLSCSYDIKLTTNKKLYLDSGGDTYIQHPTAGDVLDFYVGDVLMLHLDEASGDVEIKADEVNLMDEDGTTYTGDSATSLQTKAQIDAAISAGGGGITAKTEVSLSQAECTALHSTEIVLVAAQGANQVVIPTSVICFVDRAATQTSSAVEAFVGWNGANTLGTTLLFVRRFMWNEGGDRIIQLTRINEIGQSLTAGDNQPVTIKLDSAITTDSFTGMKVVTTYHVYDNS